MDYPFHNMVSQSFPCENKEIILTQSKDEADKVKLEMR